MSEQAPAGSSLWEFGWPLPKRKQHLEDIKDGASHQRQIEFMEQMWTLSVLRVPIGLPKYRLRNGRTASSQREWLAKNPEKPQNFFRQDPESDEVQRVQHQLLTKLVQGAGLLSYFKDVKNKQREPMILDTNGFVINGNRRLCAWRNLLKEDAEQYDHINYIDVIVLPPSDDQAIDKLESTLQVEPDIRDDYTWDSIANMMKERQAEYGLDTADLASFYNKKEPEVKELLDMLDYAGQYLVNRGKANQWSEVSDKEFAFRQMVKQRERFSGVGSKKLFEEIAFILLDDPEGGRLYEAIPDAQKYFGAIRDALSQDFEVASPEATKGLDLLGGGDVNNTDFPLAQEIGRDDASREKAAKLIRQVIETSKLLEKERKSEDFLLTQLQRANSFIQNAITAGLRPESRRNGVEEHIGAIEDGLSRIRQWLKQHA